MTVSAMPGTGRPLIAGTLPRTPGYLNGESRWILIFLINKIYIIFNIIKFGQVLTRIGGFPLVVGRS